MGFTSLSWTKLLTFSSLGRHHKFYQFPERRNAILQLRLSSEMLVQGDLGIKLKCLGTMKINVCSEQKI